MKWNGMAMTDEMIMVGCETNRIPRIGVDRLLDQDWILSTLHGAGLNELEPSELGSAVKPGPGSPWDLRKLSAQHLSFCSPRFNSILDGGLNGSLGG